MGLPAQMAVRDNMLWYPEELKETFLSSNGLNFKFRDYASTAEMWEYMTGEGPRRFPFYFSTNPHNVFRLTDYVEYLWPVKAHFMSISMKDRVEAAKKKGVPIVFVQGGQTMEAYYAANAMTLRPFLLILWGGATEDGLGYKEKLMRDYRNMMEIRRELSTEICTGMVMSHAWIRNEITPVDLIAPYLTLRCSDMPYVTESHRSSKRKTPHYLVDFPVNHRPGQDWTIDYIAKNIRRLVQRIVEVGGKEPTDDEIRSMIRLMNRARQAARDYVDSYWKAEQIPAHSWELRRVMTTASDCLGDPIAAVELLEEANRELKANVEKGIKAIQVRENPVRLFMCGSCYVPNTLAIERAGGVVIGHDDYWSRVVIQMDEEGDPYWNLAKGVLSIPYEWSAVDRAHWTIEQLIRSRADGMVFATNWGCSVQSGIARIIGETVKKELGLPVLYLELDTLGRGEQMEQSEARLEAFIESIDRAKAVPGAKGIRYY